MRSKFVALGLALITIAVVLLTTIEFINPPVAASTALELKLGDFIKWGSYNGKPLLWRAVAEDENGILMLADEVLTWRAFNSSGLKPAYTSIPNGYNLPAEPDISGRHRLNRGSNLWVSSTIRSWLNSDAPAGQVAWIGNPPDAKHVESDADAYSDEPGFLTNFSDFELSHIKTVTLRNILNELDIPLKDLVSTDGNNYSGGGSRLHVVSHNANADIVQNYFEDAYYMMVTDRIFLLDVSQLADILANSNAYSWRTDVDPSVSYHQGVWNGQIVQYWLRTPISGGSLPAQPRRTVTTYNGLGNTNAYASQGVRPAFYIDLEGLSVSGGTGDKDNPLELTEFDVKLSADNRTKKYTPESALLRVNVLAGGASDVEVKYVLTDPGDTQLISSVSQFNLVFDAASADNRGVLTQKGADYTLNITKNCTVWIIAKGKQDSETNYAFGSMSFKCFYEPVELLQEGSIAPESADSEYLYRNLIIPGKYGLPINTFLNNTLLSDTQYDVIVPADTPDAYRDYWMRINDIPSITLDNPDFYSSYIAGSPSVISFIYDKDPDNWYDVNFEFLDSDNKTAIAVEGYPDGLGRIDSFLPKGKTLSESSVVFDLPAAIDPNYSPSYYEIYAANGDPVGLAVTLDGADFDPLITENDCTIKIYYKPGQFKVTERYLTDETALPLRNDHHTWITANSIFRRGKAPVILNYVCIAYQIDGGSRLNLGLNGIGAIAVQISGDTEITYYYKSDRDNNGVPDDAEYTLTIEWLGDCPEDDTRLIKSETRTVLANSDITVTNDGISGNDNHVLSATGIAQWIFDPSRTPSSVMLTGITADITVAFYYNYDSTGCGVPDAEHYVTEKYAIYDGVNLSPMPNTADSYKQLVKGELYSKTAAVKNGYTAYGYIIDGGNMTVFPPGVRRVEFLTTAHQHTVTYVYRQIAVPATIKWVGTTRNGITITLGTLTLDGHMGQQFNIHHKTGAPFAIDEGSWALRTGTPESMMVNLGASAQIFTFYYDEIYDPDVIITIIGQSDDGNVDYVYTVNTTLTGEIFEVTPRKIVGYELTKITALDIYGDNLGMDTELFNEFLSRGKINVDPSKGKGYLLFYYEPLPPAEAVVEVRAVERGNPANILSYRKYPNRSIGDTFSANADNIEGWVLAEGESLIKTLIIQPSDNLIVFEYERSASVFIHCIEDCADNGEIILRTVAVKAPGEYYPPDLSADYFIFDTVNSNNAAVPAIVSEADFKSGRTINYYYVSEMMDVVITMLDETGKQIIPPITLNGAARKGEMYTAAAPSIPGYNLDEAPKKEVYADPLLSAVPVTFIYHKLQDGEVLIRHYYMDGSEKTVLKEHTVQPTIGLSYTAAAQTFDGFELKDSTQQTQTILVDTDSAKNLIEFEYRDVRKTISVEVVRNGVTVPAQSRVFKAAEGTEDYVIYPPYYSGYTLLSYQIDGVESKGGAYITISRIESDIRIVLNYVSYVNITILAKENDTNGRKLYEFTERVRYNAAVITVVDPQTALPKFETWELINEDAGIFAPVSDRTVEFYYRAKLTAVTIYAKLLDGSDVPGFSPAVLMVAIGDTFTYDTPYIHGYKPVSGEAVTKRIESVKPGDSLTFVYEELKQGNVRVVLKEDDTHGKILGVEEYTLTEGVAVSIPVPDLSALFYSTISKEKEVIYRGTALEIEYYYERDTIEVVKKTYDIADEGNTDAIPILTMQMGQYRVGEIVRFKAPSKDDYELADSALKLIRILPPSPVARAAIYQEVRFYYTPITSGRLVVEALNESGEILHSYHIPGTDGESLTVTAPEIDGYMLKSGEPFYKIGLIPGKVQFTYVDAEYANLTVTVGNEKGEPIPDAQVRAKNIQAKRSNTTDSDGIARLYDLLHGVYTLSAECSGYKPASMDISLTGDMKVVLVLAEESDNSDDIDTPVPVLPQPGGTEDSQDDILLERGEHISYIYGYDDGTVRPDRYVTRAEVSAMFYRLLKKPQANGLLFDDVDNTAWYAEAVISLSGMGILKGYEGNMFKPEAQITRGEFAAIAGRFDSSAGTENVKIPFADVPETHWAIKYIETAYNKAWITGYPSGEFKPDNPITRAEAADIINRMLDRRIKSSDIPESLNRFSDLFSSHWAYTAIMEAAVEHAFERTQDGYELWIIN